MELTCIHRLGCRIDRRRASALATTSSASPATTSAKTMLQRCRPCERARRPGQAAVLSEDRSIPIPPEKPTIPRSTPLIASGRCQAMVHDIEQPRATKARSHVIGSSSDGRPISGLAIGRFRKLPQGRSPQCVLYYHQKGYGTNPTLLNPTIGRNATRGPKRTQAPQDSHHESRLKR